MEFNFRQKSSVQEKKEEEEDEEEEDEEQEDDERAKGNDELVVILVHPYSILGGCQGFLGGIASGLARKGYKAVTFDMRGVGRSTGTPIAGSAVDKVEQVVGLCEHRISLWFYGIYPLWTTS
ncbi:uncharacterized protein [Coffea arabica]|uniref:Uncharacterized protein isoform X2 n=1 Tax=Coffea arabica TaxID=13443 RepID=A0ABM4UW77_COFAR